MQPDTEYRLKPSLELRQSWRTTSVLLWGALTPVIIWFVMPFVQISKSMIPISSFWPALWWALPSLAAGLLIALYRHRTAPITKVFRPSRARLLGALGLWMMMPMSVVAILPISAGYIGIQTLRHTQLNLPADPTISIFAFVLLGVSYVIACLLSHGLPQLGKRLLAYILVWIGSLSLVILMGLWRPLVL
jgi:hypothetical protein